jgi:hypothetical protein
MINIDIDSAKEIVRMLNSYTEELNNAIDTQDNSDEMIRYMEGDIANADILVAYIERKLSPTGVR